jgi:DNA-binding phage protein
VPRPVHRTPPAPRGPGQTLYYPGFTEEQATANNFPLYLAKDWLFKQMDAPKSFAQISRETGYSENTLSQAARHFGRVVKQRRTDELYSVLAEWMAGNRNMSALARKHGVSVSSVHRWVQRLSDPDVHDLIMDDLEYMTRP